RDILAASRVYHLHARFLDKWRPGTHDLVPRCKEFFAASLPIRRILNARAIGKHKGRPEGAKIRSILFWWREELSELRRRFSKMVCFGLRFARRAQGNVLGILR